MADKKITELNLLTYATAAAGDLLVIEDINGSETKAITAENLAKYALDNRTIGGTTAGDIVTIDGTQTLTNKAITSPSVNGGAALTTDSTELNLLDGLTAEASELNILDGATLSTAELNCLEGVTSAIQKQIDGLSAPLGSQALYQSWCYSQGWTEATNTQSWTATAMMTALGIDTNAYVIDPTSLIVQTSVLSGGTYTQQLDAAISWTTATASGQTYLDTLTIANITATTHGMACNFKIMAKAGV